MVEARGVEPLSEWPSSVASPCSVSSLVSVGGGLRRPTLHPASCLISTVTRSPGRQPSLVVSSRRLPDIACETSRGLSRESELVRVHIYVFDPVINEANESSSACSSELRLPVETSTPPFWSGLKILPGRQRASPASFRIRLSAFVIQFPGPHAPQAPRYPDPH